ncbi:hypothetical protein PVL29_017000 [Vitis rotundifolia]|uniref:Uncharacterized protein n=1 Tax=Vitis rotundifolia TaxID=103349 RepID=A0AA38Z9A6_VITRO|nr:hypothetical protein PVL29_017000 [Vitis rotundifolia]
MLWLCWMISWFHPPSSESMLIVGLQIDAAGDGATAGGGAGSGVAAGGDAGGGATANGGGDEARRREGRSKLEREEVLALSWVLGLFLWWR